MTKNAVELRSVSFTYAGFDAPAVDDVSLAVAPGECIVLCGESGCGKTTATRIVNGLAGGFYEGSRTGEILVASRDIDDLEDWELSSLTGSVFQNPRTQFFNLDTTGEIAFGMENLGVPRKEMHRRVRDVVRELGIECLMGRGIFELSGGQMQSVAFASAWACKPSVYVLDEPSSNLDPPSMEKLASFISKAKSSGSAVIIAEHRLSYLASVADRYLLFEGGSVAAEWDAQRKGTSYKQKLKIAIDRLIPISKDLDDLLRRLEAEGYEIKRGKYISFRAPGQERFTRAKTLGEAYTEEAIAERIKGKVVLKTPKPERSGVSLLIDIENCIKAQQSAGYERWAKIENLKRAARTMVFLDQHGISRYTDLEQKITELQDSNEQTAAALKTAEHRLSDLALLIKHTATYKELKPLYSEYKKSRDKEKYLRGREREIILFEASARALKAAGVSDTLPDLAKLREEYSRLSEEKDRLYAEYQYPFPESSCQPDSLCFRC